jgi:hypothetical protein
LDSIKKEQLEIIIADLIKKGEDADDLIFWLNIFDKLTPEEQEKIFNLLKREQEALSKNR